MGRSWKRLGLLYTNPGLHPKLASHSANPLPILLEGNVYRIFFSARDESNRSSVGAVDIDIVSGKIEQEHSDPFLLHGAPGSYYEAGISIGNCFSTEKGRFILFMGWRNPPDAHWYGEIGRIRVSDDLRLTVDDPNEPFMQIDHTDPISLSYPCVVPLESGGYAMWYGSTVMWHTAQGEMLHVLNAATSGDGEKWTRSGLAVPFQLGVAQAFSKPTVQRTPDGGFDMWFSYRGSKERPYRIGYARSEDGVAWRLALADAGIDVACEPEAWDSDMIEYPCVFDHAGERYMLYNGNGFGHSGFGLAILAR